MPPSAPCARLPNTPAKESVLKATEKLLIPKCCPFTIMVISSGVDIRDIMSTREMSRKITRKEVETRHQSIKTGASAAK